MAVPAFGGSLVALSNSTTKTLPTQTTSPLASNLTSPSNATRSSYPSPERSLGLKTHRHFHKNSTRNCVSNGTNSTGVVHTTLPISICGSHQSKFWNETVDGDTRSILDAQPQAMNTPTTHSLFPKVTAQTLEPIPVRQTVASQPTSSSQKKKTYLPAVDFGGNPRNPTAWAPQPTQDYVFTPSGGRRDLSKHHQFLKLNIDYGDRSGVDLELSDGVKAIVCRPDEWQIQTNDAAHFNVAKRHWDQNSVLVTSTFCKSGASRRILQVNSLSFLEPDTIIAHGREGLLGMGPPAKKLSVNSGFHRPGPAQGLQREGSSHHSPQSKRTRTSGISSAVKRRRFDHFLVTTTAGATQDWQRRTPRREHPLWDKFTSDVAGAFSTLKSDVDGAFSTLSSDVAGVVSTATSDVAGAVSTATSDAAGGFVTATSDAAGVIDTATSDAAGAWMSMTSGAVAAYHTITSDAASVYQNATAAGESALSRFTSLGESVFDKVTAWVEHSHTMDVSGSVQFPKATPTGASPFGRPGESLTPSGGIHGINIWDLGAQLKGSIDVGLGFSVDLTALSSDPSKFFAGYIDVVGTDWDLDIPIGLDFQDAGVSVPIPHWELMPPVDLCADIGCFALENVFELGADLELVSNITLQVNATGKIETGVNLGYSSVHWHWDSDPQKRKATAKQSHRDKWFKISDGTVSVEGDIGVDFIQFNGIKLDFVKDANVNISFVDGISIGAKVSSGTEGNMNENSRRDISLREHPRDILIREFLKRDTCTSNGGVSVELHLDEVLILQAGIPFIGTAPTLWGTDVPLYTTCIA